MPVVTAGGVFKAGMPWRVDMEAGWLMWRVVVLVRGGGGRGPG